MIKLNSVLLIAFVVLVELASHLTLVQAQINSTLEVASDPPQPPKRGTPDDREPAGTRGPCEETNKPFTPLLPVTDSGFSGFTLTEHPTFWFYVPYKTSSISSGQFSLEDAEGNSFYQTSFNLSNTPGFVSISIPTTEKILEKNKPYNWTFTLYCASQDSAQPNFVLHRGVVQRVDRADLETQLKTAILGKRIEIYMENTIWYDATTDLAEIRSVRPAWLNLFKAIGLEQLEQEAIAGSVVPIEKSSMP